MEKFKRMGGKLLMCACEIAVGVVLFIDPEGFTKIIVTAVGILFCILGAVAAIGYFSADPEEAALSQQLTRGLVALALGVFIVFRSDWIVRSFMPITVLYGIAALLTGIVKLQWTVDMIRLKRGNWQTSAIASVLSIIVAIVVLSSPFRIRKTLWVFTAIALIITGIVDGVSAILSQTDRTVHTTGE